MTAKIQKVKDLSQDQLEATNGVLKKPSKPTLDSIEEGGDGTEYCMVL